jgi:hypothetical protein
MGTATVMRSGESPISVIVTITPFSVPDAATTPRPRVAGAGACVAEAGERVATDGVSIAAACGGVAERAGRMDRAVGPLESGGRGVLGLAPQAGMGRAVGASGPVAGGGRRGCAPIGRAVGAAILTELSLEARKVPLKLQRKRPGGAQAQTPCPPGPPFGSAREDLPRPQLRSLSGRGSLHLLVRQRP